MPAEFEEKAIEELAEQLGELGIPEDYAERELKVKYDKRKWVWFSTLFTIFISGLFVDTWGARLVIFGLFAAVGVLVDERVKEGYWYKIKDIRGRNITHEKILLVLIFAAVVGSIFDRIEEKIRKRGRKYAEN